MSNSMNEDNLTSAGAPQGLLQQELEALNSEIGRISVQGLALTDEQKERLYCLTEARHLIQQAIDILAHEKALEAGATVASSCLEGEETQGLPAPDESAEENSNILTEGIDTTLAPAASSPTADVLIQAGHLNTPDGFTGASGPLGNEIDWTPIVRDEAVRILQEAGISVISADASIKNTSKRFRVNLALFIHFDGSSRGTAGASIGYNDVTDRPAAQEWKTMYSRYWPYRWMNDNYTTNLSGYYGYANTITRDAEMVLELGDLASLQQSQWLQPRLKWLGALIAHFVSARLGQGNVPNPGPFQ